LDHNPEKIAIMIAEVPNVCPGHSLFSTGICKNMETSSKSRSISIQITIAATHRSELPEIATSPDRRF
jgi:hypothetical protein